MTASLTNRTPEKVSAFSSPAYQVTTSGGPKNSATTTPTRDTHDTTELGQRILTGYSTPV